MYKIFTDIDSALIQTYEDYFCESESLNWSVEQMVDNPQDVILCGYFNSAQEALDSYKNLQKDFSDLTDDFTLEEIFEEDFKNAYKAYLKAFNYKDLHWVPVWDKDSYSAAKEGDKVFYFDAEMAFGTGDHPTTRLCMIRVLDCLEKWGSLSDKSLMDAGCGSGILALSAMLYGCKNVRGFDIEESAITVTLDNAKRNSLKVDNLFECSNIEKGLAGKTFDIVIANIQADILMMNASYLLESVKENGVLILSGILKEENSKVRQCFELASSRKIKRIDFRQMGDWSDVLIEF